MSIPGLVTNEEAETPIRSFFLSVIEQPPQVDSRVEADSVAINESPCPRAAYGPVKEKTDKQIIVRYCD